jgi:hypothetical protein
VLKSLQDQVDMSIPKFLKMIKTSSDKDSATAIPSTIKAIPSTIETILPLPESTILKNEHMPSLQKWISKKFTKFELLYRGSRDGFSSEVFHSRCDNKKGPTVTVIVSQKHGKIFGGYTEAVGFCNLDKNDDSSFLFSLSTVEKLNHKSGCGIRCNSSATCVFGSGSGIGVATDLQISDNCNKNSSNSAFIGNSFCVLQGYSGVSQAKDYLAGAGWFTVREIEAFQII